MGAWCRGAHSTPCGKAAGREVYVGAVVDPGQTARGDGCCAEKPCKAYTAWWSCPKYMVMWYVVTMHLVTVLKFKFTGRVLILGKVRLPARGGL